MPAVDSLGKQESPEAAPDPIAAQERLFEFFRRHYSCSEFDTLDESIQAYWGTANHPASFVKAGHLISTRAVHALLFYSDEIGAGVHLYEKTGRSWELIFTDTRLGYVSGWGSPYFRDWNGDDRVDLTVTTSSPMDNYTRQNVWLTSIDYDSLIFIRGFNDIENPEPARKGYIRSEYYHQGERSVLYRFSGDIITETSRQLKRE